MKKLNFKEMQEVTAGGCGWLRRMMLRAAHAGRNEAALGYGIALAKCRTM